ncbi:MAG: S8 family serine peptidase [Myxococcota bacterium]
MRGWMWTWVVVMGCDVTSTPPGAGVGEMERLTPSLAPAVAASSGFTWGGVWPGTLGTSGPVVPGSADKPLTQVAIYDTTSTVACPGLPGTPPPLGPGWSVAPLFPGSTQPRMERWCYYEQAPGSPPGPPLSPADQIAFGVELDPDRMIVTAQSLGPVVHATFMALTEEHAGRPVDLQPGGSQTRITVVDSSPTAEPADAPWNIMGQNDHGFAVTNIIRTLTCDDDGDCGPQLATSLALEMASTPGTLQPVENNVAGGDYGSLASLAASIYSAVDARDVNAPGDNLILNLSLGWHPLFGGDPTADPITYDKDVLAVYDALYYARCSGALSIAAAGNRMFGPADSAPGPLYPGGWEAHAYDGTICSDYRAGGAVGSLGLNDQPLVYAVGAITENLNGIYLTRDAGEPSRVAYGDAVTVETEAGAPVQPVTGTSAAAAVVSATAGLLWDQLPSLTADELMAAIDLQGSPVGRTESGIFCPSGGCDPVLTKRVCEVVDSVCDNPPMGTSCVSTVDVGCPTVTVPSLNASTFSAANPVHFIRPRTPTWTSPVCGNNTIDLQSERVFPAVDPCPAEQYHGLAIEPYVYSQPHIPDCPTCTIEKSTGLVFLELDRDFSVVTELTLYLQNSSGQTVSYSTRNVPTSGTTARFALSRALTTSVAWAGVSAQTSEGALNAAIKVLP